MNIFLDCGFYQGHALKHYLENGTVDETWAIFGFEPSREIDIDEQVKQYPVNIAAIKKAVWTKDGTVYFWLSDRHNASHVDKTSSNARKKRIRVPCLDFSKFVKDLPKDAYIICSMDIEGSEFPVLKKMLKDKTIDRINLLDVEFHHRMMADYDSEDAEMLLDEIERRGVKVKLKVDLR